MKSRNTVLKLVIIVLSYILFINHPILAVIPANERAALIALYNATDGDNWGNNYGWKTPPLHSDCFAVPGTEGNWYGITVKKDYVKEIRLCENKLSGSIPSELGNLGNLEYLYLCRNQLSGSIPSELGNLSNLRSLSLAVNQLSGSIPSELGNLSNLRTLYLYDNQLSGSIPSELGNLGNLIDLYLCINQLSGSIPSELGNLSNLKWLDLYYNHLSGSIPSKLGNLRDLGRLYLMYNQLGGDIPTRLSNLNLFAFGIGYNCLYTNDTKLRKWLSHMESNWDEHQDQCDVTTLPFGDFASPENGTIVTGSIPVTGWALDDTGIRNVKIYRGLDDILIYIGDAVFVEGARPDVAEKYPDYPNNNKAGWGYVLLTNSLPNSGNGTFLLHAIAMDIIGRTQTLGTRTIICDNANAVKPFGAIDTPAHGGVASGENYLNWGWALTPQPNHIPTDGSTINVWVDGVPQGNPVYNNYREDIASLFPGYNNSNGAVGYFHLDTTQYTNGVHTIAWTVTDDAGNTDGIGSRYFTTKKTGSDTKKSAVLKDFKYTLICVNELPLHYSPPIKIKQGFSNNIMLTEFKPGSGINKINIRELERLVIEFPRDSDEITGYMIVNNQLKPYPIGSTFNNITKNFYWGPGPGFIGEYHFVFILKDDSGNLTRKNFTVEIVPRATKQEQFIK